MSGGRQYAALACKSNYSFLEGASHPHELLMAAKELGISSIGIADRDGVYGMVRAQVAAEEAGVGLHVGATIHLAHGVEVVLLVVDSVGYANLCHLISLGRLRCVKGEARASLHEVCEHAEGLVAIASPRPELASAFAGRLYAPISRHRGEHDGAREREIRRLAARYDLPLVACNEVLYHHPERQALHDVLTCIRAKTSLAKAGTRIRGNAQHALLSGDEFWSLFSDSPQACKNTLRIAEECSYSLREIHYRYPSETLGTGESSDERLHSLCWQGLRSHYGDCPKDRVVEQLKRELSLIEELEYSGYFLTMVEIVLFCRREEILCQGRGSAANSLVCFCLGITAINPAEMDLLFERFISRERAEPPDIDLDIEHRRREEVIQFVYEKYGREKAAMVCNFIRYRPKSAVRDVGKVLGIPELLLDQSAKLLSRQSRVELEILAQAGLDTESASVRHLEHLSNLLLDFPRHLSIHPGGFLLGSSAIHSIVPIENGTMAGRTVIQWDKEDVEELKLFKVDLLGLGALHHLHLCFDLIEQHRGKELSMGTLPQGCQATYEMMSRGDTIGVFQIESRAQMSMLPRLRPKNFYDLVIEISIIRPGPITGGMVHPYLRRRNGEEETDYAHPMLEPILKKTLGVPLFQEQVMRLAMVAADYSPGEADQLRRDMAAWRKKGRMEAHHERLLSRMVAKGIPEEFAERVFQQILGFGEYGFPESHAASFALISYATSWLKWHYPVEFVCGLLNAQPMGFYSPATIVGDAQRHGVVVRAIDCSKSDWFCSLEPCSDSEHGYALRMGLCYVKGLSQDEVTGLLGARHFRPFENIADLARRARLNQKAQVALAEAGAFACFGGQRRDDLWSVYGGRSGRSDSLVLSDKPQGPPKTSERFASLSRFEEVHWDLERSNHSAKGHVLASLRPHLEAANYASSAGIAGMKDGSQARYAGVVICRQRPGTAKGVTFMTLEDECGFVNLVVWENVFTRYQHIAKTVSFLAVSGKVQSQEGVVHLIAERLWQPEVSSSAEIRESSRDFR